MRVSGVNGMRGPGGVVSQPPPEVMLESTGNKVYSGWSAVRSLAKHALVDHIAPASMFPGGGDLDAAAASSEQLSKAEAHLNGLFCDMQFVNTLRDFLSNNELTVSVEHLPCFATLHGIAMKSFDDHVKSCKGIKGKALQMSVSVMMECIKVALASGHGDAEALQDQWVLALSLIHISEPTRPEPI
eukprot:9493616-Pyramimonas_sp.AAC.1